MGILVPTYTTTPNSINGSPITSTQFTNVYISLRFETSIIQHNMDGSSYTITGRAKVYQNQTDIYVIDIINYNLIVTKDQLSTCLHNLIYNYLKSLYPGSSDVN